MDKFAVGFFRPYALTNVYVDVVWSLWKYKEAIECLLWNNTIYFVVQEEWTYFSWNIIVRFCSQEFYDSLIKDLKFL